MKTFLFLLTTFALGAVSFADILVYSGTAVERRTDKKPRTIHVFLALEYDTGAISLLTRDSSGILEYDTTILPVQAKNAAGLYHSVFTQNESAPELVENITLQVERTWHLKTNNVRVAPKSDPLEKLSRPLLISGHFTDSHPQLIATEGPHFTFGQSLPAGSTEFGLAAALNAKWTEQARTEGWNLATTAAYLFQALAEE